MQKRFKLITLVIISLLLASFLFSSCTIINNQTYENSSAGEFVDTVQSTLPEDKQNDDLYKVLAYIDYLYQENYVGEIDKEKLITDIMNAYIASVGDKYGMYYSPDMVKELFNGFQGVKTGLGIYVKGTLENDGIKILAVMNGSPAKNAGLKDGEIIFEIGNVLVKDVGYEKALDMLVGEPGSIISLGVKVVEGTEEKVRRVDVIRAEFEAQAVYYHRYALDQSIGVIRVLDFTDAMPKQFKSAVNDLLERGCTSIVFDVRSNTGGTLDSCIEVLDFLLPEGTLAKILDAKGEVVETYSSSEGSIDVPMAVLTDGYTASAAELFTCALKDYGVATIVGTKTYGKGCMQHILELPSGGALRYTTNYFNGPTSENFDGIGITPDVVIELDESLKNKNMFEISDLEDNQLQKACEQLLNN